MKNTKPTRRDCLKNTACGFASLALTGMIANRSNADTNAGSNSGKARELVTSVDLNSPYSEKPTVIPQRAKRVIFIFMQGGPSHIDTFDPKPLLDKKDGEKVEFLVARTRRKTKERIFKSMWKFKQHGESGRWVSSLFPEMARVVDDFCLIRSMHTEGVAHGPATLFLHTGATNLIRPSVGAWINYGLGTENQSLPGFVTINPPPTKGGPRNYGNSFLPTPFQGTAIGGWQSGKVAIRNLKNESKTLSQQQQQLEFLNRLNKTQSAYHAEDDRFNAMIQSHELAFRMQQKAPPLVDLSSEPEHIQRMYGIGEKATDEFGRQCLLARRFAESGVRYIQVSYSDTKDTPRWDQHSNMRAHEKHALATDKPVAGLMMDLKQRGLLEDTLIWWGGEFGRTPYAQGKDGRDHNPNGFSVWLAGGGTKSGYAYGETDEFGYHAVQNKVHMHDLHATILHLLGLNHKELTYRYAGRDFRLTDVYGKVVKEIIG